MQRVKIAGCYAGTHPFWIDVPVEKGGHPGNPNPGRRGILAVHAQDDATPALIVRKVALPREKTRHCTWWSAVIPTRDPARATSCSTWAFTMARRSTVLRTETIEAGTPPSADNWRTLDYSLEPYAGQTVSVIVKVSYGGPHGIFNDEAFFDEISIK